MRVGTPGVAYPQRTDMNQAPAAATGQTYGSRQEQMDAQRAVPLPAASAPPPAPQAGTVTAGPAVTPLNAPTARPNEPVTAGISLGAGPGPGVLGAASVEADILDQLQGWYAAYPTEEMRGLIEQLQTGGYA